MVFRDNNGNVVFRIVDNKIYDPGGTWVYVKNGDYICNSDGNWVYVIREDKVYDTEDNWVFNICQEEDLHLSHDTPPVSHPPTVAHTTPPTPPTRSHPVTPPAARSSSVARTTPATRPLPKHTKVRMSSMNKRITDVLKKTLLYWQFAVSTILILALFILLAIYMTALMRGETGTEVSGRAHLDFRVFYLENDLFEENPIPRNLHFLMSFTDYIEVDSRFSALFEDDVHIYYEYTATEHLVIRYMATGDANMNPIVFEEQWVLSDVSGSIFARYLNSVTNTGNIGGSYTIYPRPHIETYLDFIAAQARQMYTENIIARGIRGFSAELFVNFSFVVTVPELDFSQTVYHGYRFSLSTEVYSLVLTGHPAFTETIALTVVNLPFTMSFFMVVFLAAVFVLSVYCFCLGVKGLHADPNEHKRKAKTILKRYAGEIIERDVPLNLEYYEIFRVDAFEELLKLAINLNRHVMCHHNDKQAEFAVIVEEYAYYFVIDFDIERSADVEAVRVTM